MVFVIGTVTDLVENGNVAWILDLTLLTEEADHDHVRDEGGVDLVHLSGERRGGEVRIDEVMTWMIWTTQGPGIKIGIGEMLIINMTL